MLLLSTALHTFHAHALHVSAVCENDKLARKDLCHTHLAFAAMCSYFDTAVGYRADRPLLLLQAAPPIKRQQNCDE